MASSGIGSSSRQLGTNRQSSHSNSSSDDFTEGSPTSTSSFLTPAAFPYFMFGHDVVTKLYSGYRHEIHNYDDIKSDVEETIVEWLFMQL